MEEGESALDPRLPARQDGAGQEMKVVALDVTKLLRGWSEGDSAARATELMPLVYHELHRRAAAYLRRERRDHTLQPTALVHEAYLRLIKQDRAAWQNRAQFFGVASEMMRRILVDHARRGQDGQAVGTTG